MNTQKNTTAFQIVAVVGLLIHCITYIIFDRPILGIRGLFVLAGTALIIFGFLKGTVKPLIAGALVNLVGKLYASITTYYYLSNSYGEVRWDPVLGGFVQDAVTVPVGVIVNLCIPPLVWLLFAIAIWKKDKAVLICSVAAAANLYQTIQSFGGYLDPLIVNLPLCVMLIISGMAIQGGMQSVLAPRPVEAPKTVSNQYENLIKLKDLLDSGAITQEEFDQKKKELLEV